MARELAGAPPSGARLAALSGWARASPANMPECLIPRLDRLVDAIAAADREAAADLAWEPLFVERADALGLTRRGRVSANGSCRLVRASDRWFAMNLARPDDAASVGALLGVAGGGGWDDVQAAAQGRNARDMVARARLLGIPAAMLRTPAVIVWERPWPAPTWRERALWPASRPRRVAGLRVVDLSALWAGPLACRILLRAGAEVVKVESRARPDAARRVAGFYRRLHPADQRCERVDFAGAAGRRHLRRLIETADVVVEASRPRALEQLGCGPAHVEPREGRVWLSITGYGRHHPHGDWVAFGDDAAVAGGLVARDERGDPVFCGDAIADPLTGLVGALAVLRAVQHGGGALLDVSMASCAATAAGLGAHGSTTS